MSEPNHEQWELARKIESDLREYGIWPRRVFAQALSEIESATRAKVEAECAQRTVEAVDAARIEERARWVEELPEIDARIIAEAVESARAKLLMQVMLILNTQRPDFFVEKVWALRKESP